MKKNLTILVVAIAALAVAGGVGLNAVRASGGGTSVKAEVRFGASTVDPLASGKAKSEQRPDRTRFAVEVEDMATTGAHSVRISRGGAEIANSPVTLNVDALGFGELELNTQDGALTVPEAVAGDLVQVFSPSPDSQLILEGTLAPK